MRALQSQVLADISPVPAKKKYEPYSPLVNPALVDIHEERHEFARALSCEAHCKDYVANEPCPGHDKTFTSLVDAVAYLYDEGGGPDHWKFTNDGAGQMQTNPMQRQSQVWFGKSSARACFPHHPATLSGSRHHVTAILHELHERVAKAKK